MVSETQNTANRHRRSQSERREQTRFRILEAATELYAEQGFFAVTMRDIATRAGVALGLIYHYFEGKEQLLAEQIEYTTQIWLDGVRGHLVGREFDSLDDFLVDYLMYMRRFIQVEHPNYFRFYMKHIHLDNLPHLEYMFTRVAGIQPIFNEQITAAIKRGEISADLSREMVEFVVEMVSSRVQEACYSDFLGMDLGLVAADETTARRRIREVVRAGLSGLRAKKN